MLKQNGILYLEVPNQNCDLIKLSSYYKNNIWYMKAHVSYFTPNTLTKCLKDAGWENINVLPFERYGYSNWQNWVKNNKPQKNVTFFDGNIKTEGERIFHMEKNKNLTTDCMYVILQK